MGKAGGNTYGRCRLTTDCRTRRRCGCSRSRQRQIGSLGQIPDRMGMNHTTSHPCCPNKIPSSRSNSPSRRKSIITTASEQVAAEKKGKTAHVHY